MAVGATGAPREEDMTKSRITGDDIASVATQLQAVLQYHGLISDDTRVQIGCPYATGVWRAYAYDPRGGIVPCSAIDAAYDNKREAVTAARAIVRALWRVGGAS
jgi:hypothetical protein